MQSLVRFNRIRKRFRKSSRKPCAKPSQLQLGKLYNLLRRRSGEAFVQSQIKFNRVLRRFRRRSGRLRRRSGRLWRRARSASIGLRRRFRRRSRRLWCKARPGSAEFRSKYSGEGLGDFGINRFRKRFRIGGALVQSQVSFNRVMEKVPEKV